MKNRNHLFVVVYLAAVLIINSCNNETEMKFDKQKWNLIDDPALPPPFRSKMLNDLITNYEIVGLKYAQLLELLGKPDYKDTSSLTYIITEDYGSDIDPIYTRNLCFSFSKDSVITSFKVKEWEKQ